ncbi:flagellar hook-basal body complex protein [Marinagarivorans algicola]|uniref:flagellar hook-basal body complex protein n=1 Tax=Marinagarivorans algicola TaxID=1513270 RepID=UPI0006B53878|nr:flagellar hook-basal body complex protein [Marinagarivorans algicola]
MPFNTALSGIRAASSDLKITGNNIANASTSGFKRSRAEFGDVYAISVLGSGSNTIGSGVRLQSVSQNFNQGSMAFTENSLDLAVNGNGFFVVQQGGEQFYTRAGTFGLDKEGFVVNNVDARLQGFPADDAGNISGLQGDIQVRTSNLAPRATTNVDMLLNLDSSETVLQSNGTTFNTTGNSVAVTRAGLSDDTTTTVTGTTFTFPLANDFRVTPMTFDVELTASTGENGTVSVNLNTAEGIPATVNNFNELLTLEGVINTQLSQPLPPQSTVDVFAKAVDMGGGNYRMDFVATKSGEASQVRVLNASANAADIGIAANPAIATSTPGIAKVDNGYPEQTVDITDNNGGVISFVAAKGQSAAQTASSLNALNGVTASASTTLTIPFASFNNSNGDMTVTVKGVKLSADNLSVLADNVNALSNGTLQGVTASIDTATGDLTLTSSVGDDIPIRIESPDDGDSIEVFGNPNAPSSFLEVDTNGTLNNPSALNSDLNSIVVGGSINIVLDEGYTASNAVPPSVGLFGPLTGQAFTEVIINEFDPNDQGTYNWENQLTIFDSLGNSHVMTNYYVKQEYDANDPSTTANHWKMFTRIDGEDVGDPDTSLPPPQNIEATVAVFDVYFNDDGSLNNLITDDVLISNWTPKDADGNPNGAMTPQNVLNGGNTLIGDPPTSSNFVINLEGTTQFSSDFSVNDVDQSGYSTGRLSGLNIGDDGVIFARFTNGESQVLGQLALADFASMQGLQPVGDTMWAENYESGTPNIGAPQSGALGAIQSGALEESNVDLSEELVRLIIAQRNFQASAKTIETADSVTQTIINMR